MKYFLLIAGSNYYPGAGSSDWVATFETREKAESWVVKIPIPLEVFQRGPRKGQIKPNQTQYYDYKIKDYAYDWYEIVDLDEWSNSNKAL